MSRRFNIMKKINVNKSLIFGSKVEDIKNSLEYLGQEGYFSNSKDFSEYEEAELDFVEVSNMANSMFSPYKFMSYGDRHVFCYFIPKSKAVFVEEEPKKKTLRQFKSLEEFFNVTGFKVGDIVQIQKFGNLIYIYEETAILTCIRLYNVDERFNGIEISFGSNAYSFDELFKHYRYFKNGKWMRFGIEE